MHFSNKNVRFQVFNLDFSIKFDTLFYNVVSDLICCMENSVDYPYQKPGNLDIYCFQMSSVQ